jgi:hypothetical protein
MNLKQLIFTVLAVLITTVVNAQNSPTQKETPPGNDEKYKTAVSDIEKIGTAIEAYLTDHSLVPRVVAIRTLKDYLVPHHIQSMPIKDPWGNLYIYDYRYMEKDEYSLICSGSDGRRKSAANDNIVYENGAFTYIPSVKIQTVGSPPQSNTPGQVSSTITSPAKTTPSERLKYETTMNHMRQIGMALDAYSIDNTIYPNVNSIRHLPPFLIPTYTHRLPLSDPWGNDYQYKSLGSQGYFLGSGGSDGKFEGFNQVGIYKNLSGQDIIYKDGLFILSPKQK